MDSEGRQNAMARARARVVALSARADTGVLASDFEKPFCGMNVCNQSHLVTKLCCQSCANFIPSK